MVLTAVTRPAAVMAADGQSASPRPGSVQPSAQAPRVSARPQRATGGGGMPKLGKASNPYDMNALRNFDAGSHQ
jgi:hypothetical protein